MLIEKINKNIKCKLKKIKGFVCVASTFDDLESRIIFGKNYTNDAVNYESLQTNGLIPYRTLYEMIHGYNQLRNSADLTWISQAHLSLNIAESHKDLHDLRKKNSFVVIMMDKESGTNLLFGPPTTDGIPDCYPLLAAYLFYNRLRTFESYDRVEYVANEIKRQSGCKTVISTFKFSYLW